MSRSLQRIIPTTTHYHHHRLSSVLRLKTNSTHHDGYQSIRQASTSKLTIKIIEVGPRDGLQNEKSLITTHQKVQLIQQLANAGCTTIEAGSFVSPKWVPQMANSLEVLQNLSFSSNSNSNSTKKQRPNLSCLVPNKKGMEQALQVRSMVGEVAVFAAASEEFSQRNISCTIEESMERFRPVADLANENELPLRGYVSTVVACPYEGHIDPKKVATVVEKMLQLGCYEISLGDTIGVGTPGSIREMLKDVLVSQLFVYCCCFVYLC